MATKSERFEEEKKTLLSEHELEQASLTDRLSSTEQSLSETQALLKEKESQVSSLTSIEEDLRKKLTAAQQLCEQTVEEMKEEKRQALSEQEDRILAGKTAALFSLQEEHDIEKASLKRKTEANLKEKEDEMNERIAKLQQKVGDLEGEAARQKESARRKQQTDSSFRRETS